MATGNIYIGTSGWHYNHWKKNFYPENLKQPDWLSYYGETFHTGELNNSFYRTPNATTFEKWKTSVPPAFVFAVKANRFITHSRKLQGAQQFTTDFIQRSSQLDEKLGPILFQLPPYWSVDKEALADFANALPNGHRYVFEFRNQTWYDEEVYEILRANNCAFCIYELAGHLSPLEITADFVYVRLHGPGNKYEGKYTDTNLSEWSKRGRSWQHDDKTVYIYFDNDQHGYAVENAKTLKAMINA
ncbi:DUF72 domain-containing protein [Parapedobacter sp.]